MPRPQRPTSITKGEASAYETYVNATAGAGVAWVATVAAAAEANANAYAAAGVAWTGTAASAGRTLSDTIAAADTALTSALGAAGTVRANAIGDAAEVKGNAVAAAAKASNDARAAAASAYANSIWPANATYVGAEAGAAATRAGKNASANVVYVQALSAAEVAEVNTLAPAAIQLATNNANAYQTYNVRWAEIQKDRGLAQSDLEVARISSLDPSDPEFQGAFAANDDFSDAAGFFTLYATYFLPGSNPAPVNGFDSAIAGGKWLGWGMTFVGLAGVAIVEVAGVGGVVIAGNVTTELTMGAASVNATAVSTAGLTTVTVHGLMNFGPRMLESIGRIALNRGSSQIIVHSGQVQAESLAAGLERRAAGGGKLFGGDVEFTGMDAGYPTYSITITNVIKTMAGLGS